MRIVIPVADWPQYCCLAMNEEQLELAARLVCTVVSNHTLNLDQHIEIEPSLLKDHFIPLQNKLFPPIACVACLDYCLNFL